MVAGSGIASPVLAYVAYDYLVSLSVPVEGNPDSIDRTAASSFPNRFVQEVGAAVNQHTILSL
ncbi:MAG: hypothetical protein OXN21_03990, partial [Chloroflexota bacterium]|nr:hypothetical protein [Chloroflexota bacterium]